MAARSKRLPWKELSLSLASTCAILFVLDRAFILYYPPFVIDGSMLIHDEQLGCKLRPNHISRRMGFRTNSAGFRGPEFTITGPRPIVAFVGDSVTFGAVTDPNTFPEIFQEATGWRTFNFGVPYYGPREYARLLPLVQRYSPDLVVVTFFIGNDVADCSASRRIPIAERQGTTSRWSWSGIYRFLVLRRWIRSPALEAAVEGALESRWNQRTPQRDKDQFVDMELARARVYVEGAYRDRWECVRESFLSMRTLRPDLVVLIVPDEMQVNEDLWDAVTKKAGDMSQYDRWLPNRTLKSIAEELRLRVIDATPALRSEKERTYFRWDSHPNPLGNRLIASALRKELASKGAEGRGG